MKRVATIEPAGTWDPRTACDRVVLDADERQRRRVVLTGQNGAAFLLDLAAVVSLRDGDGLRLEDGSIVAVAGQHECLLEITPGTALDLLRLAWHLGNRHAAVQIVAGKLRMRDDHVLADLARGMGAQVRPITATFDPVTIPSEHHR